MKRLSCIFCAAVVGFLSVWVLEEHLSEVAPAVLEIVWKEAPLEGCKPQDFLVYYATSQDNELSERQVIRRGFGSGELRLNLPKDITSFRLDLGFANPVPEDAMLSYPPEKIEINGVAQQISEPKVFRLGNSHYIAVYCPDLDVKPCRSFCLIPTIVCFVVVAGASYWAASHLGGCLVSIFFALCLLPWSRLSEGEISVRENRKLATFPTMLDAKAFEAAFNDRMFGREWLLNAKNLIAEKLGAEDKTGKALVGREGWLYYRETLDDFSNTKRWSEQDMRAMGDYLDALFKYCTACKKRFAFIICPDKCRVYPEYVTQHLKVRPDAESKTELLVAYLRANYAFPVVYPRERMLWFKPKVPRPLYYLKDTHWNWEGGCYGGYQPMMEALGVAVKEVEKWKEMSSDAGDMLSMNMHATDVPDVHIYAKPDFFFEMANPQSDIDLENARGQGRLFMLRDSFATAMTPYIYQSFQNASLRWRTVLLPEDRAVVDGCDYFVYEIVERSLPALKSASCYGCPIPWEVK